MPLLSARQLLKQAEVHVLAKTNATRKWLFVFWTILFCAACGMLQGCSAKEKTITYKELQILVHGPKGRYSSIWTGTFYCGSRGNYHYVQNTNKYGSDLLKVEKSNFPISNEQPYPLDKSKWIDISDLIPDYE